MNFKKYLYLSVCALLLTAGVADTAVAQNRDRVTKTISSRPINQPQVSPAPSSTSKTSKTLASSAPINSPAARPSLTNQIKIHTAAPDLIKKTASTSPRAEMAKIFAASSVYAPTVTGGMLGKIDSMLGIPYLYGATGPNRYDCSGFVWTVFKSVGIDFERTSARSLWHDNIPVTGDERFKFGTLVFFNNLGHVGIVADKEGFYHASSSKGITYSKFDGYWGKRIVGFRRIPQLAVPSVQPPAPTTAPAAAVTTAAK